MVLFAAGALGVTSIYLLLRAQSGAFTLSTAPTFYQLSFTVSRRLAVWVGLLLPFVLWPVYHARNGRWVREAELSSETIKDLQEVAKEHGSGATVLLKDDPSERPSLVSAFGTTLPAVVRVMVSPQMIAWIDPPPLAALPRPERFDAEFQGGKLIRIR